MDEPVNPLIAQSELLARGALQTLVAHEPSVQTKYEYYNADQGVHDFGISTPGRMVHTRPGIGWAGRAVNTLSDRVVFDGFANDQAGMNDLFRTIGANSVITKVKHDSFIAGCAFVAVGDDMINGGKVLIPFTAAEATGEVDQRTGLLKWGLAVTKWGRVVSAQKKIAGILFDPEDYMVFTPNYTAIFVSRKISKIIPNTTGRTLLHPITHRASADQPLGKSRLSNTARRIIQEVSRLKRREEIAEEYYALPQRYINGLAEGAEKDTSLETAIGKIWAINKDEDGDKPDIGQLAQMSIDGFIGAKKDKARDFCAETGLTLRNLGYETGNPSSAESLVAMSDDLLLEAQNSQVEIGEQIKNIAITLRMSIDNVNTVSDILKALVPAWKPIFQVDLGAAGDAVFKLFEAMPELKGTQMGYRMLGMSVREAEELQRARTTAATSGFMDNGGAQ